MTRRSHLFRHAALFFAMMQMAMPCIASIADAWHSGTQWNTAPIHADEHSEQQCAPSDAQLCALCQFAAHCARDVGAPGALAVRRTLREAIATREIQDTSRGTSFSSQPRAPPVS